MELSDVLLRGNRASQPLAANVPEGTLYYVTDESVTEQSRSSAWVTYSDGGTSGITQLTGDVTAGPGSGSQAASIAANAVVSAKINAKAVTYAKIQDISATARILGRKTAAAGVTEECTLSEILDFLGSAAWGDILFRGTAGWQYLAPGTSGNLLQTNGAGADPTWVTPPSGGSGAMTLLHSGEGTDASVGATTVDTYALASQLGVKDSLMILITMESNGNTTSSPGMKNSTDGVAFATNSITGNTDESYVAYLRNAQSSTKRVDYWQQGYQGTTQIPDKTMRMTWTTDWTGAWTLALVHAGVASGGTFTWRWSIYKISGT